MKEPHPFLIDLILDYQDRAEKYVIRVKLPYTKKRNAKRKRGWAEMQIIWGPFWLECDCALHGAN
jgi:hypothetical protein